MLRISAAAELVMAAVAVAPSTAATPTALGIVWDSRRSRVERDGGAGANGRRRAAEQRIADNMKRAGQRFEARNLFDNRNAMCTQCSDL